jgi:hypothetical protein
MRTLRMISLAAVLTTIWVPFLAADECPTNAGGLLASRGCVAELPGVDAAALVRAVRESERWIHQADSLVLRVESVWARNPAGTAEQSQGGQAVNPRNAQLVTAPAGVLEYAFDRSRLRFLDDEPEQCRTLKVWDGKQLITRETQSGRRERYGLDAATQGNLEDIFATEMAWPRSQPHSFWWDSRDVDDLLAYYGRPEEFKCIARENYRGVQCHVLAMWPTEVRAILFGQSYECDSGVKDQQAYGLIGEVRGLVDQSCRWYAGVEDGLLHGILWSIGDKPRLEHWMSDYRQVRPGWWFPMTQGYQIYKKDSAGEAYVDSRRDLKVLEIKLNEALSDALFQLEIRVGARVEDRRSGQLVAYEYRPKPPELLGKPLPPLNHALPELDLKSLEAKPVLLCFWDMHQRPSRHCLAELARQNGQLESAGVRIVAVQVAQVEAAALSRWTRDNPIPFPVVTLADDAARTLSTWNIRALPWLVLTDQNHIVKANGFPLRELSTQLASVTTPSGPWAAASPLQPRRQ